MEGFAVEDFDKVVRDFYDQKNEKAAKDSNAYADDLLLSEAPPQYTTVVDEDLLDSVFDWTCKHPDVTITRHDQPAGHVGEQELTESVTESSVAKPRSAGNRLYASEDRVWHAIAGHGVDRIRLPRLEFDILSVVAARGSAGIIQPDVRKLTGQDKRSVPKRTDKLAEKGYITKEAVFGTGTQTSLLKLKRYQNETASSSRPPTSEPSSASASDAIQSYDAWFDKTMQLLNHGQRVVSMKEIRTHLGISRNSDVRTLVRCIRRLAESGCVRRLNLTSRKGTGAIRLSSTEVQRANAIQLLREPTSYDRMKWQLSDPERKQSAHEQLSERGPHDEDAWTLEVDMDDAAASGEEGEVIEDDGVNDLDTTVTHSPPQWTPHLPVTNQVYNIIDSAGRQGMNSTDLALHLTGGFWKRPLDEVMARLTDAWQYSQPPHLKHLGVVKDTALNRRLALFQYRSLPNHQQAVAAGEVVQEGVNGSKAAGKQKIESLLTDVDGWGFPMVALNDLAGRNGRASLVEGRKGTGHGPQGGSELQGAATSAQSSTSYAAQVTQDTQVDVGLSASHDGGVDVPQASLSIAANITPIQAHGFKRKRMNSNTTVGGLGSPTEQDAPAVIVTPVKRRRTNGSRHTKSQPAVPPYKKREIPQEEYQEYEHAAEVLAERLVMAELKAYGRAATEAESQGSQEVAINEGPSIDRTLLQRRVAKVKEDLIARKKPGVYINPPGARTLKLENYVQAGRPRKALIAVIKTDHLKEKTWFLRDDGPRYAPKPSRRRTITVGRMSNMQSSELVEDSDSEPTIDHPNLVPEQRHWAARNRDAAGAYGESGTAAQTAEDITGRTKLTRETERPDDYLHTVFAKPLSVPAPGPMLLPNVPVSAIGYYASVLPVNIPCASRGDEESTLAQDPRAVQSMPDLHAAQANGTARASPLPGKTPKSSILSATTLVASREDALAELKALRSRRGPRSQAFWERFAYLNKFLSNDGQNEDAATTQVQDEVPTRARTAAAKLQMSRSKPGPKSKAQLERVAELQKSVGSAEKIHDLVAPRTNWPSIPSPYRQSVVVRLPMPSPFEDSPSNLVTLSDEASASPPSTEEPSSASNSNQSSSNLPDQHTLQPSLPVTALESSQPWAEIPAAQTPKPTSEARSDHQSTTRKVFNPKDFVTTAYVNEHPNEDFHHRGQGMWARGLPPPNSVAKAGVRGPGAKAWKEQNQGRRTASLLMTMSASRYHQAQVDTTSGQQQRPLFPRRNVAEAGSREGIPSSRWEPSNVVGPGVPPVVPVERPRASPISTQQVDNLAGGRSVVALAPVGDPNQPGTLSTLSTPRVTGEKAKSWPLTIVRPYGNIGIGDAPKVSGSAGQDSTRSLSSEMHNIVHSPRDAPTNMDIQSSVQALAQEPLPLTQTDHVPQRQLARTDLDALGGTVHAQRQNSILNAVRSCGGAFPGNGEIWYPAATVWRLLHNKSTERHIIENTLQKLLEARKLKKLAFQFTTKKGVVVKRSILAEPGVGPESLAVKQTQKKIIECYPFQYLPAEVEIDEYLRHQASLPGPRKDHEPGQLASITAMGMTEQMHEILHPSESSTQMAYVGDVPETRLDDMDSQGKEVPPQSAKRKARSFKRRRVDLAPDGVDDGDDEEDDGDTPYPEQLAMQSQMQIENYQHDMNGALQPRKNARSKISRQVRFDPVPTTTNIVKSLPISSALPQLQSTGPKRKPLGSLFSSSLAKKARRTRDLGGSMFLNQMGRHRGHATALLQHPVQEFYSATGTFGTNGIAELDGVDAQRRQETEIDAAGAFGDGNSTNPDAAAQSSVTMDLERPDIMLPDPQVERENFIPHSLANNEARPVRARRKYKSRLKVAIAEPEADDSDGEFVPEAETLAEANGATTKTRKWKSVKGGLMARDRQSAVAFKEVDRLVTAQALVAAVCGGVDQDRMNWNIVAHCLSFRYDGEFLRRRWSPHKRARQHDVDRLRDAIREPFLMAYEQDDLPRIDYQELGNTDWPTLLEWVENEISPKVGVTLTRGSRVPDLLDSRAATEDQYSIEEGVPVFELSRDEFFTTVTDMQRKHLTTRYIHGQTLTGQLRPSEIISTDWLLIKSWVRAIAVTKQKNYNADAAAKKIRAAFTSQAVMDTVLGEVTKDMIETRMFVQEKKGRQLPGRNFQIHHDVLQPFRRWPARPAEHRYLRYVATSWANLNQHFVSNESLQLVPAASDPEYLVLTNMVAQGLVSVTPILPERNDNIEATGPRLTKWGYAGLGYEMKKVNMNDIKFPIVYTRTERYPATHGLTLGVPIPREPAPVEGEDALRIPFWVDIHGSLIDDIWDMVLRSLIHLVVFRPGSTAAHMEKAHNHKLWAWEIELALMWMEKVGIAERCGSGSEVSGIWQGGWRAGGFWYCAFVPEVATWRPPTGEYDVQPT